MKLYSFFVPIFIIVLITPTIQYGMSEERIGLKHNSPQNNLATLASSTSSTDTSRSPSASSRTMNNTPIPLENIYNALITKNTELATKLIASYPDIICFSTNQGETIISLCIDNQLSTFLKTLFNNSDYIPRLYTTIEYLIQNAHKNTNSIYLNNLIDQIPFNVNILPPSNKSLLDTALDTLKKNNCFLTQELVKLLIKKGADTTPYVNINNLSTIKRLINMGADPTPMLKKSVELFRSSHDVGYWTIINFLLKNNASILEFVKANDINIVLSLIEHGAQLKHPANARLLHSAALRNFHDMVDLLLSRGVDPKLVDDAHRTAVYATALFGDIPMVQKLLKAGVPPFEKNSPEEQLITAVLQNDTAAVHTLLTKTNDSARPNVITSDGTHILTIAYKNQNSVIANDLIEHGCSLLYLIGLNDLPTLTWIFDSCEMADANEKQGNITLIKKALEVDTQAGQAKIILLLLKHGASIESVLDDATLIYNTTCIQFLLDVGIITITSQSACSFIHSMINNNNSNAYKNVLEYIINYLKSNNALDLIDIPDRNGRTALYYAVLNGNVHNTERLLAAGASDEIYDKSGNLLIHNAILIDMPEQNKKQIIELLLRHGKAGAEARTKDGATILHCAASGDSVEVASDLIAHFKNLLQTTDKDGNTPLHYAAQRNNIVAYTQSNVPEHEEEQHKQLIKVTTEIITMLIINGADINAQNNDGDTPLMIAVKYGNMAAIKTLLELQANPLLPNRHNQTPLDIATHSHDEETTSLLQQHIAASRTYQLCTTSQYCVSTCTI